MPGGRPQVGLDPATGPLAAFAAELRALRVTSGTPTYRVMAGRSGVPAGSLARTARGLVLPRADLVRAYVLACGGDELLWMGRWREMAGAEQAHRRAATGGAPRVEGRGLSARCPPPGGRWRSPRPAGPAPPAPPPA